MTFQWTKPFIVQEDPSLNDGDKIILPSSSLQELLDLANGADLPSPMTFALRHPHHSNKIIHGGVKEFSSQDGIALVPPWMISALDLTSQQRIVVQSKQLPKGTWTKLRPLTNDYQDIKDYRAALEAHLRQHYNTLTIGQTLTCRYGSHQYPFLVVDLQPDQAVGVNDTDLEVDLESYQPTTTLDTSATTISQQQQPEWIKLDQQVHDVTISRNTYYYWILETRKTSRLYMSIKVISGDADVIAGYERPTIDNYTWGDLSSDKERQLKLEPTKDNIYVGIYGYSDCVISWKATLSPSESNDLTMEDDRNGKVQCNNCQAWVPERTLPLHESFCQRNNMLCPWGCGQVFKKNGDDVNLLQQHWHCDQCSVTGDSFDAKTKHMDYFHTSRSCDQCAEHIMVPSLPDLAKHRQTTCSERLILCRYCHNLVVQGPLATDARDRLLGLHGHEIHRQNQKLPPLCCNQQCTRPRSKNRLGFCQYCFGPFWVTEDDPNNVKLVQRVARKLHGQLTMGCGNAWCQNKYCATGSQTPQDATTAASTLIPMIQKLTIQLAMPKPLPVLYLCVDAKTTRIRFLAETLRTSTDDMFGLDWCIKAIETEQEDLDKAKQWLNQNAPRKGNSK
ncbi:ubiquitin fusion degradation protein UFD1-domain-containing protein [Halteromyces radiatus]|uniref:ubiquitin fusion degradation protein UFD1-domain-containing protein n=1 Tax=Halteromyces radiatus TaxID=101107 RepID=UPI00221F966E|nr:ubiquitin fusion degradation protein UFD1-domain-containing protein [Halteromyces radiatus]KAI8086498.1 ubiquitin fusion degradation protein UFD1-domain-containing protein [Halteromyces radiatus]